MEYSRRLAMRSELVRAVDVSQEHGVNVKSTVENVRMP